MLVSNPKSTIPVTGLLVHPVTVSASGHHLLGAWGPVLKGRIQEVAREDILTNRFDQETLKELCLDAGRLLWLAVNSKTSFWICVFPERMDVFVCCFKLC